MTARIFPRRAGAPLLGLAAGLTLLASASNAQVISPEDSERLLATGEIIESQIISEQQRFAVFVLRHEGRIYACRVWIDSTEGATQVSCWGTD